eukprot:TRINITY_DN92916_c0_g1_i1.p1 TRINITY_DN92916_c0_g1~~TRINITY_DN92916_c0_g1_i1.p1  ORF type:complete len:410 (-),score=99.91 TRINITY_DN92916_c0_g1_i1:66-1295(-)
MAAAERSLGRSPTFLVNSEKQRNILDEFKKRDQHLSEQYQRHKPLCFNASTYQKTHPKKMINNHRDADAALVSPMLLGVADGVSQIEEFGIDASELPNELLAACEEIAMNQLFPGKENDEPYLGPIPLVRRAYQSTESIGSTTLLLSILDNSTKIHGKLHPMIAVLSIGDCEVLILRRPDGRNGELQAVFHTEMQRIDGHAQSPLQVARVDDRIDKHFTEDIAIEVIERGSAVHCLSAYEGDVLVLGSDGVFDNLFLDEVVQICNEFLPPDSDPMSKLSPSEPSHLKMIARKVVEAAHAKTRPAMNGTGFPDTPIGRGGKIDDTCVVVGEVLEWTIAHTKAWEQVQRQQTLHSIFGCGGGAAICEDNDSSGSDDNRSAMASRLGCSSSKGSGHPADSSDEEDSSRCVIL